MQSSPELIKHKAVSVLPNVISYNPRELINDGQVRIENIISTRGKQRPIKNKSSMRTVVKIKSRFPLEITWYPNILTFCIENDVEIHKLRVCNASLRSIYIHCCGLWNERGRIGASWCCYPRTRSLLAPGLAADLCIKATPKDHSPVPSACMVLQLAAAHLRDHVVGYFVVPVKVNFLKHTAIGEEGQE